MAPNPFSNNELVVQSVTDLDELNAQTPQAGRVLLYTAPANVREQFSFAALRDKLANNLRRKVGDRKGAPNRGSYGYTIAELEHIKGKFPGNAPAQLVREMDYALDLMKTLKHPRRPTLHIGYKDDNEVHYHPTIAVTVTLCGDDRTETTRFFHGKDVSDLGGEQGDLIVPGTLPAFAPNRLDVVKMARGVWHSSPGYQNSDHPRLMIATF
jgi:hypothetical protein